MTELWILEDDTSCKFVYQEVLDHRYRTRYLTSIGELVQSLNEKAGLPSIVIADLKLEDGTFLQFLATAETRDILTVPFLIVSSIDDIDALRFCFDEGALDYLVKPFHKNELLAKVERAIHRAGRDPLLTDGMSEIYDDLTSKERQILSQLLAAPNRTLGRDELVSKIWKNSFVHPKTLDVHLYNLRKKLHRSGLDVRANGFQKWVLASLKQSDGYPSPQANPLANKGGESRRREETKADSGLSRP